MLKYRRGPRPRGSWRYPLWFVINVRYTSEEKVDLNPDWEFSKEYPFSLASCHTVSDRPQRKSAPRESMLGSACSCRDKHGRGGQWNDTAVSLSFVVEDASIFELTSTLHFSHLDDREAFIKVLHLLRGDLLDAASRWWQANPPVPGDPDETTDKVFLDQGTGQMVDLSMIPAEAAPAGTESLRRIRV